MQFVYPAFLIGLIALAIPIIIHLFHFRRFKKVYFTNVKFLKEVKEETSARSRIKNLLVLLARCLALAFLVFAFAQPFIPQDGAAVKSGQKAISVFVDNSFSMSSLSQDVPLIEKAKERARQIVSAYESEDEFQVLTNDFEGRHQRLVSQEDALALIDEIDVSPSVKEMSKVVARQKQILKTAKADNKETYVISDFQKNVTDLEASDDTTVLVHLVPLQSVQQQNVSIDSCWFEAPVQMINQTNRLIVKITNHSNEANEDVPLTLKLDNQVKPIGNIRIKANETSYDTVNVTILRTGLHEAELSISDFPINFDDAYFFSFNVAPDIKVLSINEATENKFVNAVYGGNPYFKLENQRSTNVTYSTFSTYKLIILNNLKSISSGLTQELSQYVKDGGNLIVFPNAGANLATYQSFLTPFNTNQLVTFEAKERAVSEINTSDFVFKDVYENARKDIKLPSTQGNFKQKRTSNTGEEPLLKYRDGSSFFSKYKREKGSIYLCAAPLDVKYSTLVQNAEIFVPMLYKIAISNNENAKIAYTIGRDNLLEADNTVSNTETVYKLQGDAEEFIPQQRSVGAKVILGVGDQMKDAGFYNLFLEKDKRLNTFAFNFDRKESNLQYNNITDLKAIGGQAIDVIESTITTNFEDLIGERSKGISLWRWCIILVLVFLGIEILLLRFWKK
ncbi:MAG: BatA domain-containing protein [Saprospiraceae bacterium]